MVVSTLSIVVVAVSSWLFLSSDNREGSFESEEFRQDSKRVALLAKSEEAIGLSAEITKDPKGPPLRKGVRVKRKPRLVFKGEDGAWYRVVFVLKEKETKRSYVIPSDENGIAELNHVKNGHYNIEMKSPGVSLDSRYGANLVVHVDQENPKDTEVFLVSDFPRKLMVSAHLSSENGPLENIAVSVNWRGQDFKITRTAKGVYEGHVFVVTKTKEGPAEVVVRGMGIDTQVFVVKEDAKSRLGHLVFEKEIKLGHHLIDVLGHLSNEKGEPLPNTRLSAQLNNSQLNITTDGDGNFVMKGVQPGRLFYVHSPSPHYSHFIKQNGRGGIELFRLNGMPLVIIRRYHHPTTLEISPSIRKLFAKERYPQGSMILIPLTRTQFYIDSKLKSMPTSMIEELYKGQLELRPLPPGEYYLVLSLLGQGSYCQRFRINDNGRLNSIKVSMNPVDTDYSLTLNLNGQPVSQALVLDGVWPHVSFSQVTYSLLKRLDSQRHIQTVSKRKGWRPAIGVTNAAGEVQLKRGNSDNKMITVFTADGACHHLPKKNGSYNLEDYKGTVLSGFVSDKSGNPLKGVQVQLTSLRGGENIVQRINPEAEEFLDLVTDERGYYEISGIIPGQYLATLCFSTKRRAQKGIVEKHYQIDKQSFQVVTIPKHGKSMNFTMKRSVKRCSDCGLYHTDEDH